MQERLSSISNVPRCHPLLQQLDTLDQNNGNVHLVIYFPRLYNILPLYFARYTALLVKAHYISQGTLPHQSRHPAISVKAHCHISQGTLPYQSRHTAISVKAPCHTGQGTLPEVKAHWYIRQGLVLQMECKEGDWIQRLNFCLIPSHNDQWWLYKCTMDNGNEWHTKSEYTHASENVYNSYFINSNYTSQIFVPTLWCHHCVTWLVIDLTGKNFTNQTHALTTNILQFSRLPNLLLHQYCFTSVVPHCSTTSVVPHYSTTSVVPHYSAKDIQNSLSDAKICTGIRWHHSPVDM